MRYTWDELIEHPDPFKISIDKAAQMRFETIKEVFTHHYTNNNLYNKYCRKHNITPDDIKSHEDLLYIPLLPSDMFKALSTSEGEDDIEKIASVPRSSIITYFTTSGTTGIPTRYPFDRESIRRTTVSNTRINRYIGEIHEDSYLLMLTPSLEETKTGLVQGMYMAVRPIVKNDDQISFGIKNGKLDLENIITSLSLTDYRPRHLFGPPFVYKEIAEYLIKKGGKLKLEEESKAFMSGGWKRVKGEVRREELDKLIYEAFGVYKENIRDGLGLTDIFSWLLECSYHKKHIPPWMHVSTRNPKDLKEEVNVGEEGLFAFLTSAITSYPPFIISGDIGVVTTSYKEKCECGRIGPTVEHRRRATGMAARGCALVIEEVIKMMRK
jgi:long-chain-fatty-acid---luciferin-component ligase